MKKEKCGGRKGVLGGVGGNVFSTDTEITTAKKSMKASLLSSMAHNYWDIKLTAVLIYG